MRVVLPEDSGPKISTMRPRARPPTPSARSSEMAPVEMALTLTAKASSPIFMIEPAPNWRSICPTALCSADSRALAAFSCSLSMVKPFLASEHTNVGSESDRFPRPVPHLVARKPLLDYRGPMRRLTLVLLIALIAVPTAQAKAPPKGDYGCTYTTFSGTFYSGTLNILSKTKYKVNDKNKGEYVNKSRKRIRFK